MVRWTTYVHSDHDDTDERRSDREAADTLSRRRRVGPPALRPSRRRQAFVSTRPPCDEMVRKTARETERIGTSL